MAGRPDPFREALVPAAASPADLLFDGFVSVTEAARLLSVSRSFLYAAMDRGEIAFAKFGRARRLPRRAVLEYAVRHLHGAAP